MMFVGIMASIFWFIIWLAFNVFYTLCCMYGTMVHYHGQGIITIVFVLFDVLATSLLLSAYKACGACCLPLLTYMPFW